MINETKYHGEKTFLYILFIVTSRSKLQECVAINHQLIFKIPKDYQKHYS